MKRLICILTAILMLCFCVTAHADFGDFAGDYDYGGDLGSDFEYDFGNDYGDDYDYDSGGIIYFGDDDYPDSGLNFSALSEIAGVLIFVAIVVAIIIFNNKRGAKKKRVINAGAKPTDVNTLRNMNEYISLDPGFSESEFKEKISNMYVQFQNAWQNKDMDELRPYLTMGLFSRCERQLEEYKRNHRTNKIERIAVLDVTLTGWTQQDGVDIIPVRLKTRIVDYVVDDVSGNIIRGSDKAEKFMEYEWLLVRTSGKTTADSSGTVAHTCPNCGAPLEINHSAKCEYCNSIIETDTFNWAVRDIKGISQRTVQ